MFYILLFILFLSLSVTTRSASDTTNLYWESLMSQGQHALHDNPKATFAPKPKLSPRSIPKQFDARKKWPKCKKIFGRIQHQGKCGSCWAVSSAAMISEIHCIHTGGAVQFSYSSQDILSCAPSPENNGCAGGYLYSALDYWMKKGCPSGGEVGSNYGCLPYSLDAYWEGKDVGCARSCTNKYTLPYDKDRNFGSGFKYERIQNSTSSIQHSIMTYGPVLTSFKAGKDFAEYNGSNVYRYERGDKSFGHAAILLGWGEQKGVPYWLGQNSWGKRWGAAGYFKFLRGKNHCQIEEHVIRLSKEPEKQKITKKPKRGSGGKYYGRRNKNKGRGPRGEVKSGKNRYGIALSNLLLLFILIWLSI